jgi:hypothetical protein
VLVALCVSGRIDKDIKEIYKSWKENLINFYNVDIFMNFETCNIYTLGLTDQNFIANRYLMNNICNIYLILEDKNYTKINCRIPEILLLYYLKKNNLEFKYFKYNWIINYYNKNIYNTIMKLFSKIRICDVFNSCLINLQ